MNAKHWLIGLLVSLIIGIAITDFYTELAVAYNVPLTDVGIAENLSAVKQGVFTSYSDMANNVTQAQGAFSLVYISTKGAFNVLTSMFDVVPIMKSLFVFLDSFLGIPAWLSELVTVGLIIWIIWLIIYAVIKVRGDP